MYKPECADNLWYCRKAGNRCQAVQKPWEVLVCRVREVEGVPTMVMNEATDPDHTMQSAEAAEHLILYRHLLSDPVISLWHEAITSSEGVSAYCRLAETLLEQEQELPALAGCDAWQRYLASAISGADNVFGRRAEHQPRIQGSLRSAVAHDLGCLEEMYHCTTATVARAIAARERVTLPACGDLAGGVAPDAVSAWLASTRDWAAHLDELARLLHRQGCGLVGRFPVLRFESGRLSGVRYPDLVSLDDLTGYDGQRAIVLENTRRFCRGLPANNLLLYGERGTGKSATVKAVAAYFAADGLRLVEVRQDELAQLPTLLELLRPRAQRFIIFVDDVSFADGDTAFKHLKAFLEGTVQAMPANVIVYATSNRRHFVAEYFADRADSEVRSGDSKQEKLALADRFGRTVVFAAPDQEQYLAIVRALAQQAEITVPEEELLRRALAWTAWENSRSPRTARQFVTDLAGELAL